MNPILQGIIFAIIIGWPFAAMLRQFFFSRRSGDGNSPGRAVNGDYRFNTVTPSPVSPVKVASTTFVWGSKPGGTDILPLPTGQVAQSLKITPKNGKPVLEIENGDGNTIEEVLLIDGFDAELDVLVDTSLTYPACGVQAAATLTLPVAVHLSGSAKHTVFPCTVWAYSPSFERKGASMMTISVGHRPGVDGAATT